MHTCAYACVCIYVCMYVCIVHLYMYVHVYMYVCVYVCIYMYIRTLEIIIDLPIGFPINNIISLYIRTRVGVHMHSCRRILFVCTVQSLYCMRVYHRYFLTLACVCVGGLEVGFVSACLW